MVEPGQTDIRKIVAAEVNAECRESVKVATICLCG